VSGGALVCSAPAAAACLPGGGGGEGPPSPPPAPAGGAQPGSMHASPTQAQQVEVIGQPTCCACAGDACMLPTPAPNAAGPCHARRRVFAATNHAAHPPSSLAGPQARHVGQPRLLHGGCALDVPGQGRAGGREHAAPRGGRASAAQPVPRAGEGGGRWACWCWVQRKCGTTRWEGAAQAQPAPRAGGGRAVRAVRAQMPAGGRGAAQPSK
jgi:hypothetical protein